MKVCVLGAGGFIGKNLLHGTDWVGVTRHDVDLLDQSAVEEFFNINTYDVVVHCASSIDQQNETTTYKNILMFENVSRVFKGKLLYFSSGAALRGNPPIDPYGLSKWIIDQGLRSSHTHTHFVFGGATVPGNYQPVLVRCVRGRVTSSSNEIGTSTSSM